MVSIGHGNSPHWMCSTTLGSSRHAEAGYRKSGLGVGRQSDMVAKQPIDTPGIQVKISAALQNGNLMARTRNFSFANGSMTVRV
jgi:hypothetical protein